MSRTTNIGDMTGRRRSGFFNPVFDAMTRRFDEAFHERHLSDDFILQHFYVDRRAGGANDAAKILELFESAASSEASSTADVATGLTANPGMLYMVLGKRGTGKTVFLKHLMRTIASDGRPDDTPKRSFVYLDLRPKKSNTGFLDDLPTAVLEEMFYEIKRNSPLLKPYLEEPDCIRQIDPAYQHMDPSVLVQRVMDNKAEALELLFHHTQETGHQVYVVMDNIDDFPVSAVRTVLDVCFELKSKFSLECIVALRDQWTPQRLDIVDANICCFFLKPPDIAKVVSRRLDYVCSAEVTASVLLTYGGKEIVLEPGDLLGLLRHIVNGIEDDPALATDLFRLSNYDTREHLMNMYHFFHSPYLFSMPCFTKALVEKIRRIDPEFSTEPPRRVRLFDFLECFMAVHSLCYDISSSKVFNIFHHPYAYDGGPDYRNVLIYTRILRMLPSHESETLNKGQLVRRLESLGYGADAVCHALDLLLRHALVESVQGVREADVVDVSVSAKGNMYSRGLLAEYTYLLYVSDAVPLPTKYRTDVDLKYGTALIPLNRGDLDRKIEGVENFIRFIEEEEAAEAECCPERGRPLLQSYSGIGGEMREQVELTMQKLLGTGVPRRRVDKIERVAVIAQAPSGASQREEDLSGGRHD